MTFSVPSPSSRPLLDFAGLNFCPREGRSCRDTRSGFPGHPSVQGGFQEFCVQQWQNAVVTVFLVLGSKSPLERRACGFK